MTPEMTVGLLRDMLMTAFWLCAPLLLIAFGSGIVLSLVQIVTSIQDTAFSTIPRLIVFLAATVALLPWMLTKCLNYTSGIFSNLAQYAR